MGILFATTHTKRIRARCAQCDADIKTADLLIVFVGTDTKVAAEDGDRPGIDVPGNYDSLINQVHALGNPKTALVIQEIPQDHQDDIGTLNSGISAG